MFLKNTWRLYTGTPGASLVSLISLSVAFAAILSLAARISFETSYDSWVPSAGSIVKMESIYTAPSGAVTETSLAPPIPSVATLPDAFPEFEAVTAIIRRDASFLIDDEPVSRAIAIAEPNFFDVFDLRFMHGASALALAEPDNIVVSERQARRQFGKTDVVGETLVEILESGELHDYTIVGVFETIPENTHFTFDILRPISPDLLQRRPELLTEWGNLFGYVYAKLAPGASVDRINSDMEAFKRRFVQGGDANSEVFPIDFRFVPLTDVYLLHSHQGSWRSAGDPGLLRALVLVAILILLVAATNFATLVAAHATGRAREIGIRRIFGASRYHIFRVFMFEAGLFAAISALFGVGLMYALQVILRSSGTRLSFAAPDTGTVFATFAGMILTTALLAAMMASSVLMRYRPTESLGIRGGGPDIPGGNKTRQALVVFQFAVGTTLMFCTVIVYLQTRHARDADYGYEAEGLIAIEEVDHDLVRRSLATLASSLERIEGVFGVAGSSLLPAGVNQSNAPAQRPGAPRLQLGWAAISPEYFDLARIELLAGRFLSEDRAMDDVTVGEPGGLEDDAALAARGGNVILSETAMRQLGFADQPRDILGQSINVGLVDMSLGMVPMTVVGIVSDARYRSLRDQPRPMMYFQSRNDTRYLLVRVRPGDEVAAMASIRTTWSSLLPELPLKARVIAHDIDSLYNDDAERGAAFALFALIAVTLACLGLYGLAAYAVVRQRKDVAIRKIHGAGKINIIKRLALQFVGPVIAANILAIPISWLTMRDWLAAFDSRITLEPLMFITASIGIILVGMLTVGGQSYLLAGTMPIKALRHD